VLSGRERNKRGVALQQPHHLQALSLFVVCLFFLQGSQQQQGHGHRRRHHPYLVSLNLNLQTLSHCLARVSLFCYTFLWIIHALS
jgi:hypothetical protein